MDYPDSDRNTSPGNRHGLDGRAAFLDVELTSCIDWFQRRREKCRLLAFSFKILATLIGAATTVVLGLKGEFFMTHSVYLSDLALILSSIVTILTATEAFFDFRALWVRYSETRVRLLLLKARLGFLASGGTPLDEAELETLFDAYEQIINESNAAWLQLRRTPLRNEATLAERQ
jgi:hypothetical protein